MNVDPNASVLAELDSTSRHKELLRSLLAHFSTYSIIGSATAYATGFLIVFIFHDSYGLRGADNDIFKARFFHVGIMFLALLLNTVLPFVALFSFRRYRDANPKWLITPLGISIFALMAVNFLVALFFAPSGAARQWSVQIGLILTIIVPLALGFVFGRLRQRGKIFSDSFNFRLRLGMNGLLFICFICIVGSFWRRLVPILWPQAFWFLLLAVFMALVSFILVTLGDEKREPHEQHLRVAFCIAILAMLYFFEINAFASGIFHFIPAAKGGGDFTDGRIVARLSKEYGITLPKELVATEDCDVFVTKNLVLIEASSSSIYVADPTINGGPPNWRLKFTNRPPVFEIKRDAKTNIEYRHDP
jgi:hypothetical protein